MWKFTYTKTKGFKNIGEFTSHGKYIKKEKTTETIRGLTYEEEKIIYLRINNLFGQSLKDICRFFLNFTECIKYLKKKYKKYKIHCSYSINELPEDIKRDILGN